MKCFELLVKAQFSLILAGNGRARIRASQKLCSETKSPHKKHHFMQHQLSHLTLLSFKFVWPSPKPGSVIFLRARSTGTCGLVATGPGRSASGPGILRMCSIFPPSVSVPFTAFPISILGEADGDGSFTGAAAKPWEFLLCDKFKKILLVPIQFGPKSKSESGKKKEFLTNLRLAISS